MFSSTKELQMIKSRLIWPLVPMLLAIGAGSIAIAMFVKDGLELQYLNRYLELGQMRNNFSSRLNLLSKKAAILSCEQQATQNVEHSVSDVGGWCETPEQAKTNHYQHKTDIPLANGIASFLAGKRVASFGEGLGHYKEHIDKMKMVARYDAYDGGPYYGTISNGSVKYLDLTIPQYGLPCYDWVISIDVAEHIPQEYDITYLDNIARHAKEGIIISWAIPGQAGVQHVNNQHFYYMAFALAKMGFSDIVEETEMIGKATSMIHLKQNIGVFRRDPNHPINMEDL